MCPIRGTDPGAAGAGPLPVCEEVVATNPLQSYRQRVTTPPEPRVDVSDVRALRALAHPLRNRLLALLRLHGPSTATLLGARVGESSGSTSYHLRQLAAHGFVEEVPDRGTGRERWWRARHRLTSWSTGEVVAQEGGAQVQDEMNLLQLSAQGRVLNAWWEQREELGDDWTEAASLSDYALRLTPGQARALAEQLGEVVRAWLVAHPPERAAGGARDGSHGSADTQLVSVLIDVLPLVEWPT